MPSTTSKFTPATFHMNMITTSITFSTFFIKSFPTVYYFTNKKIRYIIIMSEHHRHIINCSIRINYRFTTFKPYFISITSIYFSNNPCKRSDNKINTTITTSIINCITISMCSHHIPLCYSHIRTRIKRFFHYLSLSTFIILLFFTVI